MSYFEYQTVYFGIIVGLALANILTSFHKLIEAGDRVRWGWLAPVSALYAAVTTLGEFWSVWVRQRDMSHDVFLTWLPTALAFALLFLLCAAALPDEAVEAVDLRSYYTDNRRRFWGFAAALYALNVCTWVIAFFEQRLDTHYISAHLSPMFGNAVQSMLCLSLVLVRANWWQVLAFAAIWVYALFYFGPLPLH